MNNMMGRLPTLDEHNRQRDLAEAASRRNGAGVACPQCPDTEMFETNPGALNTSHPPSTTVQCPKCGHIGYKR